MLRLRARLVLRQPIPLGGHPQQCLPLKRVESFFGVPAAIVEAIKHRRSTQGLDETYAAIIEFGRQAVGKHKVDAAAFARLKALFAPNKLVDLVLLMGNYAGTAILLAAFDMQVAEGRPILPVP